MPFLFIILLFAFVVHRVILLASAFIKRAKLMRKMSQACNSRSYKLTRMRNPYASFFKKSVLPDITIETQDTLYCVRFITCIMKRRYYHFASEEVCVKVRKVAYALKAGARFMSRVLINSFILWKRIIRFPKLVVPESDKNVCRVWLFNPSPLLISHRNEKGVIEDSFNCSEIFGAITIDGRKFIEVLNGELVIEDRK